jgi:hypothetical protein
LENLTKKPSTRASLIKEPMVLEIGIYLVLEVEVEALAVALLRVLPP